MRIVFRGTRGTAPSSGRDFVKYGGATSCVEVEVHGIHIFFDAGTGIMSYGANKGANVKSSKYFIFLSHLHYDHLQGLPFFTPMFDGGSEIHIYGEKPGRLALEDALEQLIRPPYLPFSLGNYPTKIVIHEVKFGEVIQLDGDDNSGRKHCQVEAFALQHPGGSVAYKLTDRDTGKTFVYATDTEMPKGERKKALIDFVRGTNLLVVDSFFTNEEMKGELDGRDKSDWGHMSFEEAVELASLAEVERLALFHHHNERKDEELDKLQERARTLFNASFCASDNQELKI